jgi:hypothetical protein
MSGGQDEASEYIKTGGTNVFKKTERTKCGNCVYYDGDLCNFDPVECRKPEWGYCRHFHDMEPHGNAGDVTVRKEGAQPATCCQWSPDKDAMPESVARLMDEVFRHRTNASLSMLESDVANLQKRMAALEKQSRPVEEPAKKVEEVEPQPAGERREWWCVVDDTDGFILCNDREDAEREARKCRADVRVARLIEAPSEAEIGKMVQAEFWELSFVLRVAIKDAIRKWRGDVE